MSFLQRSPEPLRRVLAQTERDIMAVVDQAVEGEMVIARQQAREITENSLNVSLKAFSEVRYYEPKDPVITSIPSDIREAERRKMNQPAIAVIKALTYCEKHPGMQAIGQLKKMQKGGPLKDFPTLLEITYLPLLIGYGRTYAKLTETRRAIGEDLYEVDVNPEDPATMGSE